MLRSSDELKDKKNSPENSPIAHIKNLVFQGGSVRGIGHIGGFKALLEVGLTRKQIECVAGTSAGAIVALMVSLGYTVKEMKKILRELDFKNFLDEKSGHVRDALLEGKEKKGLLSTMFFLGSRTSDGVAFDASKRLNQRFGLFEGEVFRHWAERCIKNKTGVHHLTFKELHELRQKDPEQFKDLYMVGEDVNTGLAKTFSYEDTPTVIISDALRISMSIPIIFEPHQKYVKDEIHGRMIRAKSKKKYYVDGGMRENYPLLLFDNKEHLPDDVLSDKEDHIDGRYANPATLGFRLVDKGRKKFLEGEAKAPEQKIGNFIDYLKALINNIYQKEESDHVRSQEQCRTIYIDTCGVGMLDFDISEEQEKSLFKSGKKGVRQHFGREEEDQERIEASSSNQILKKG